MKRLFILGSLLLLACNRPFYTKQQIAERLVEEYIHIANNPEAIKKTKFTELTTHGTSDNYEIGIIENRWDKEHHVYFRTMWYILNHDLTHVVMCETT
ncbi:MAG: hypothetical protein ACXVB0_14085 [Mucilaginibacter sp.]